VFPQVYPDVAALSRKRLWCLDFLGLCPWSLRLIQQPDKPGKMPSLQHVYEGILPWYRIFSSPAKEPGLLPTPRLRTGRESFPSSGSSISKAVWKMFQIC
jgi:hypothetical protein